MKKSIFSILVIAASLFFFGCSEDNALLPGSDIQANELESSYKGAKKPAAKLIGTGNVGFTFPPNPNFWNGTIDFGDYGIYGITFISYTAPRDFSQASPFEEDFIIFKLGTDWTISDNVVMRGWNAGVVTYANKAPDPVKFHANGKVEEAYGLLAAWEGCNVHIKGLVYFLAPGLPEKALSTMRIN